MTAPGSVLVETRGLVLYAGGRCLVEGLDWQCREGERWCVIGRNAVGKTTLLRALAGLTVVRREGLVIWQGRDQSDWSAAAAATLRGFMQQQAHDRFSLTVGRLLELSVCVPGRNDPRLVLDQLDAGHLRHRDVMCLSGGERQRVALAQCAMQGAPLMLLDEPVAFQDPAHQAQVGRWLKAITSAPPEESSAPGDEGTTGRALGSIVVTAHDVNWMAGIATHVLALYGDGRWASDEAAALLTPGTLQAVYGCPWRRVGDAFIPGG